MDEIENIGDILGKLVKDLNMDKKMKVFKIFNHWEDIVGQQIAEKSKPEKLKDGILFVSVASSTWANELNLMSQQLILKVNSFTGLKVIKDIRFKANM